MVTTFVLRCWWSFWKYSALDFDSGSARDPILRALILHIALNASRYLSNAPIKYDPFSWRRGVFSPCRKQALAMDMRNAIVQKIVGAVPAIDRYQRTK